MIKSTLPLLLGLFRIHHTTRFYVAYTNKIPSLFLSTILTIPYQVLFVEQFLPCRTFLPLHLYF